MLSNELRYSKDRDVFVYPTIPMANRVVTGPDGQARCWWCGEDPLYVAYHDTEWGRPVSDDVRLFEKLVLEGFQAGLSWLTILRKRENFRAAFAQFDIERVARFTPRDVKRLLNDAGIVRHRGKIESAINNAKRCCDLVDSEGSLARYLWRFEPAPTSRPKRVNYETLTAMAITPESTALSKDLKKRGWRFVGPTTMYAAMQAMGLVNDHLDGCHRRTAIDEIRQAFVKP